MRLQKTIRSRTLDPPKTRREFRLVIKDFSLPPISPRTLLCFFYFLPHCSRELPSDLHSLAGSGGALERRCPLARHFLPPLFHCSAPLPPPSSSHLTSPCCHRRASLGSLGFERPRRHRFLMSEVDNNLPGMLLTCTQMDLEGECRRDENPDQLPFLPSAPQLRACLISPSPVII